MAERIMFTGGGGAGNEAIYRLFGDRYDVHFADSDPAAIDPSIPAGRRHAVPPAAANDYAAATADICNSLGIGLLVPGVDEELPLMPSVSALATGTDILVPQPEFVTQSMDKLETAQALHGAGLPAPATATMAEVDDFDFPCFAKPRQGRGSRGIRVLADREEARAYKTLAGLPDTEILLQELLQGREFTVMMAADSRGNLHAVVPVEIGIKRGITVRARTNMDDGIIRGCRAIHQAFRPAGCYNIQLMYGDEGRVMPFEINPRVSTTFCLGIAAGIDPVDIFRRTRAPENLAAAQDGLHLNRHWTNVIH